MSHPNSLDLEAFACGDESDAVATHVERCEPCRTFVDRVRGVVASGPSKAEAREAVERAVGAADRMDEVRRRRAAIVRASSVIGSLALAAVILLVLRTPPRTAADDPPGSGAAPSATTPTVEYVLSAPLTSFKGTRQIAVIRERDGVQERFTGKVPVRVGDRLRIEVALDREQAILAAVLGDDESYLELMPPEVRPAGTHYSEKAARVTGPPVNGSIVVGSEGDIEAVRRYRDRSRVDELRIEWEKP